MADLQGKTLFITGASRGIGKAIALRAARDGARIAIAAKTAEPNPKLPGTIHDAAREIEAAGGQALALQVDIRDEAQVQAAVARTVSTFGGIDILVNNASAIFLAGTEATPMKRFDLMLGVNVRGTFACSQAAIPHLRRAANPHILNLSPPLDLEPRWFRDHCAYTISKYGMSMCVLGMAEELRGDGIAVNALWPRTTIATAALAMLGGLVPPENCRRPEVVADAAHAILVRPSRRCTGNFFLDEQVLAEEGVADLSAYAVSPGAPLLDDLFVSRSAR
jgi:citronellol/citronellal dehydrogenase